MNDIATPEGTALAAASLKAIKYGDAIVDCSTREEVGFLMLARIYQCFVADHQPPKK